MRIKSLGLAVVAVVGFANAAWAVFQNPNVISLNVCNALSDAGGWIDTEAAATVETLAGGIPCEAWQNFGHTVASDGRRHGSISGVKAWDGLERVAYDDVVVAWNCNGADMGNLYANVETTIPFLRCTYTRANQTGLAQQNFSVAGIPFLCYDVIVYFSGSATTANQSVLVNGTGYYGDPTSASDYKTVAGTSTSWGSLASPTNLAYGVNALRVEAQTDETLTISVPASSTKWGVSAIQIVERQVPSHDLDMDASVSDLNALCPGEDVVRFVIAKALRLTLDETFAPACVRLEADEPVTVTLVLTDAARAAITAKPAGSIYTVEDALGTLPQLKNVMLAFDNVPEGYINGLPLVTRKSDSISIKTGPRSLDFGYITPYVEQVGAYPVAGYCWNNTYPSDQNNASDGYYNDIMNLWDGKGELLETTFAFYARNTYFGNNSAPSANGNAVLTATYVDDGEETAAWTVRDQEEYLQAVALPEAPNARGWQLRIADIPYEMYDLYIYVASDVGTIGSSALRACSLAVSVDGGTSWKFYAGDPDNAATIVGSSASTWKANPYSTGTLTEGTNYIKIRVSRGAFGATSVSTVDVTHAPRDTSQSVRSGLAGIQIVKVDSDGVYNRAATTGNWTATDGWTTSDGARVTWVNPTEDSVAYANIDADTVASITIDEAITASRVKVSSTAARTFALDGTGTLTAPIDFTDYRGALVNPAFNLVGTMTFGANSYLELSAADGETYVPSNSYTVIGTVKKTGTGTVQVNELAADNVEIAAGTLMFATDADVACNAALAGAGTFVKTGSGTLTLTQKGSLEGPTEVRAGTLKFAPGAFPFWNGTARTATVGAGATLDLNGAEGYKANITLESGATWKNGGAAVGDTKAQAVGLTLDGNATVATDTAFGLLCNGYGDTSLSFGGHTLTKTGSGEFILYNTQVTGSGTLDIQEGTVRYVTNKDRDFADADLSINLGANATFKVDRWFTAKEVTGSGTLDLGIARMTDGIFLAEGSDVCVRMQIRNKAANEDFTIPCGAGTPRLVQIVYPDGTPCLSADVTIADGKIRLVYDKSAPAVALAYPNPVDSSLTNTYTWAFAGWCDGDWKKPGNWMKANDGASGWVVCDSVSAPGVRDSAIWNPLVFDGDRMALVADADGCKCVTASAANPPIDGWCAQYGLYNRAKVTIGTLYGVTCGDGQEVTYCVDATSQLVISAGPTTNYGVMRTLNLFAAAKEGVVFAARYDLATAINYNLMGEGSVKFAAGLGAAATHAVRTVKLVRGAKAPGVRRGIVTRPLVAFAVRDTTPAFDLSAAAVSFADCDLAATCTPAKPARLGEYRLYQAADGVYVQYIGYAADAVPSDFSIHIQ